VHSTSPLDPAANILVDRGVTTTAFDSGVSTYDGRGAGTFIGRSLTIAHEPKVGQGAASESEFTCTLTYSVDPDGMTFTTESTCTGKVLSGPSSGETSSVTGIKGKGRMLESGRMLLSADTSVHRESLSAGSSGESSRVCNRATTSHRVSHQIN
jgi:hypothetical protein